MRLSPKILEQVEQGPDGDRLDILLSYGGFARFLCGLGRHDTIELARTDREGCYIYQLACVRCGRLLAYVRARGDANEED